ncbi:MAG: DUF4105 domain-containing protein [Nitrospirae bacterium]|nr:DUF4105 domain-containing protein [Nitrospirota bacterium]
MTRTHLFISAVVLTICLNGVAAFAADAEQDAYLNSLAQEARTQNLAEKRYWLLLVHYKKTLLGGYESQEDGPDFFNSPNGKTDPETELIATLKNFFRTPESLKTGEEHPQCNFPARYKWLKTQLAFDPTRLPEQRCERLEGWLKNLNPEKITLIFASHYMNNPASMFGHTFLRIDKKREGPEQKLLDYGVNYSAAADSNNPLVYMVKGLFGGFKGIFTLFPYYVKVQEYNNLENRDLWEYELKFTDDQMNYFLLHLWELGGNYFDYYYFQENCSYHMLSLLEVANPDLHLTDQFLFQVIPADTVKVVSGYDGLISKRVYRPSLLSQVNQKRFRMSGNQNRLFYRLIKDPSLIEKEDFLNLTVPEKAMILDAYLDYAQYKNMQQERTAAAIDQTTRRILLERSKLDYRPDDLPETTRFSTPPELGHGSAHTELGFGRNGHEQFEEVSLRPAYHDLLANDTGYGKDSQILFLDLTARRYNESEKTKIDNFKLIDIISLTPYDPLFNKKSWKLSIGLDTIKDLNCGYCNSLKGNYGIGAAYQPGFFSPLLLYSLIDLELELSRRLDQNYRLGGGGTIGALLDITDHWRIQTTGDYISFPLGNESHYYKASVNQRYSFTQNLDIRAGWNLMNSRQEWLAGLNYYF